MSAPRGAEFFYDCASPWNYLAFLRLIDTATRTATRIAFRPIEPGQVPDNAASLLGAGQAARSAYQAQDLRDWARFCGVHLATPAPCRGELRVAQQAAWVADQAGAARPYLEKLFHARHVEQRDITDRALLSALATECGLADNDFAARIDAPEARAALTRNTQELLGRGGFATPALFVGDQQFVGHDRMPLVEFALLRASDKPFIAPGEHHRL